MTPDVAALLLAFGVGIAWKATEYFDKGKKGVCVENIVVFGVFVLFWPVVLGYMIVANLVKDAQT